jgi:hypothetical protein
MSGRKPPRQGGMELTSVWQIQSRSWAMSLNGSKNLPISIKQRYALDSEFGEGLIAETPLPRCRSFRTSYDLSPNFGVVAPFTKVHCIR